MIRGKASRNVPPAATSHTSCQLHNGPIAAITSRRSAGVLATIRCNAPAPMSQPSRTTKITSRKVNSPNHSSTTCHPRAVHDFVTHQEEIEQPEHEIETA